jgi:hypothetical protein
MTTIQFVLDYVGKEPEIRTFSPEGLVSFLGCVEDYLNKLLIRVMATGFEKNEPVNKFEMDVTIKVNGKALSKKESEELMKQYPNMIGLSKQALIDMMQEKDDE